MAELYFVRKIGWIRVIRQLPATERRHSFSANQAQYFQAPAAPAPMITTSYFMDPPSTLCLLRWDFSELPDSPEDISSGMNHLTATPAPIASLGIFARDQEKADAFLRGRVRSPQLILQPWMAILSRFRNTCSSARERREGCPALLERRDHLEHRGAPEVGRRAAGPDGDAIAPGAHGPEALLAIHGQQHGRIGLLVRLRNGE